MAKKNIRDTILDAVNRVVAKGGLSNTTIEAVAAEAGVSKGGLLYYFSTKKDLLIGMLDRYETSFFERRAAMEAEQPDDSRRLLRATVKLFLADMEVTRDKIPNFATVLDDVDLRQRVGEFKRRVFKGICAQFPNPGRVALILYTIDGLWMNVRFETSAVSKPARAAVVKEIHRLIEEEP